MSIYFCLHKADTVEFIPVAGGLRGSSRARWWTGGGGGGGELGLNNLRETVPLVSCSNYLILIKDENCL